MGTKSSVITPAQSSGNKIATYKVDEANETRDIQRMVVNDSEGAEIDQGIKAGEDPNYNQSIVGELWQTVLTTGFHNNAIWVQGVRTLGKMKILKPASSGVRIKIYDDYYNRPPTDLKADVDATDKDASIVPFRARRGVYVKIDDPGGGATPPIVMWGVK